MVLVIGTGLVPLLGQPPALAESREVRTTAPIVRLGPSPPDQVHIGQGERGIGPRRITTGCSIRSAISRQQVASASGLVSLVEGDGRRPLARRVRAPTVTEDQFENSGRATPLGAPRFNQSVD